METLSDREEKTVLLEVDVKTLPILVSYLSLGVLHCIADGSTSTKTGIWTLGMPKFWEPLEQHNLVSERLLKVLQTSDEVDVMKTLGGDSQKMALHLISELVSELQQVEQNRTWGVKWHVDN